MVGLCQKKSRRTFLHQPTKLELKTWKSKVENLNLNLNLSRLGFKQQVWRQQYCTLTVLSLGWLLLEWLRIMQV